MFAHILPISAHGKEAEAAFPTFAISPSCDYIDQPLKTYSTEWPCGDVCGINGIVPSIS